MQEYCLENLGNNALGEIGEVLANNVLPYTHRTKGKTPDFLNQNFFFEIPEQFKLFLSKKWLSLDLFRFILDAEGKKCTNIELFEVKTSRKRYRYHFWDRQIITKHSLEIYEEAKNQGVLVTLVEIQLMESWKFRVQTSSLFDNNFSISSREHYNIRKKKALFSEKSTPSTSGIFFQKSQVNAQGRKRE